MRYETGIFILKLYDELGSKYSTQPVDGFLKAVHTGEKLLKDLPDHSFVVFRVVHNSKMVNKKWGV